MATYAAYRHVELDNVGYGKKRVLKPPGGGSSDIFGTTEVNSPRRAKNYNQSQLSSDFFGSDSAGQQQQQQLAHSNGGSASETPRSKPDSPRSKPETPRSKPGNDSYKRLFGPPDPPSTPNKDHMRSSIQFSPGSTQPSSPARTTPDGSNGHLANGNGYHHNDVVGGSSCLPRNPVTGDGVDIKPHASRRMVRRSRDGNPVTGAGYDSSSLSSPSQQNGNASSAGSDKSSTDSSPSVGSNNVRLKNRVPPGGFSSGLW